MSPNYLRGESETSPDSNSLIGLKGFIRSGSHTKQVERLFCKACDLQADSRNEKDSKKAHKLAMEARELYTEIKKQAKYKDNEVISHNLKLMRDK